MDPFIAAQFGGYFSQCPVILVDIGASGGIKKTWNSARKHLRVIGFEPDDRAFRDLKQAEGDKSVTYLNTGLYNQKTSVDFHLTRKQQLSSIYKPNERLLNSYPEAERFDIVKTIKLKTNTLDNELQENNINDVDFIKIDTQGSELSILQGATRILRNSVFGLEIEVEFIEVYDGQPLFSDIDPFLRKLGFQLFDLRPCYWKRLAGKNCDNAKGQIIFGDALYLKGIDTLDFTMSDIQNDDLKKCKILKAVSICVLCNHQDYALELVDRNRSLFSLKERTLLMEKLKGNLQTSSIVGSKIPNFRGRGRISDALYCLWKILQPKYWKTIIYLNDGQRLEKF